MGFGKKTDFETNRVLDLDKSYRNMIKPAVEAAGLKCIRADEIVHSGLIDVPMYEQLLKADVVVADLSTSNKNAFYELGIRHALRPFTTVVIAEDGIKTFPFDISHVAVRQYHHLGEDIGYEEVMRFREQLTSAIREIVAKDPRDADSPVYTFLKGLTPPEIAAAIQGNVQEVIKAGDAKRVKIAGDGNAVITETHSVLMGRVDAAQKAKDWLTARSLLGVIRQLMKDERPTGQPEDAYILQRLSLATYKSKSPDERSALLEALSICSSLQPESSNDPETLGLWGAANKRLWELTKDVAFLNESILAYERGYYIRNDYYNGINYAYLLNVRAAGALDLPEAIADFTDARRARKKILGICEQWLQQNPMPGKETVPQAMVEYLKSWYWVKATMGEAYVGLGDEDTAKGILEEAYNAAPEDWMKDSTEEQLGKLRKLLENPPYRFLKESER
jgi:tetratricopeptide (TPR) repeat protein